MKKILLILFLFPMIVFAGDIPFALMQGEEQALAIGQIVEQDEITTIRLDVFLMGTYSPTITVDRLDHYYMNSQEPKKDDLVIVVIDNDQISDWFFKVSSTDYKSLVLYTEESNMSKSYEELINSGAYFEAQMALDPDLGKKNLYNAENMTYLYDSNRGSLLISLILFSVFLGIVYWMFIKK